MSKALHQTSLMALACAALVWLPGCQTPEDPNGPGYKPKKRPTPPPPPGSDISSQPWAKPEKEWEGGKPAFMPSTN